MPVHAGTFVNEVERTGQFVLRRPLNSRGYMARLYRKEPRFKIVRERQLVEIMRQEDVKKLI
jgi:hypothetical protein